ncbi:hypothetical protein FF2_037598 [Malus domestica]
MVAATLTSPSSQLLCSSSRSLCNISSLQQCVLGSKTVVSCPNLTYNKMRHATDGVRCMAVTAKTMEPKKKSRYEIQTLTSWLLMQEQAGVIDAELTIMLSSISVACQQIASLVQRASISKLDWGPMVER